MLNLIELFEKHNQEYIKFEGIPSERRLNNRPDMHAFLLLDKLVPGSVDMVSDAEHDEIYLSVDPAAFAAVATEEQVIDLIRCGVRFDETFGLFAMFA